MKLHPIRGLKFGLGNAVLFPIVMAANHYLRGEAIVVGSLLTGSIFAFLFFAAIWTVTDKLGSEIGG